MKPILKFITALCILVFGANTLEAAVHISHGAALGVAFIGATLLSFMPSVAAAHAVVLKQMWEAELIKAFRQMPSWLGTIMRRDNYVNNNTINLQLVGADPNVLINNSSYPIASNQRTDDTSAISLFKYETENTIITDDELYALPYDKKGSVMEQHRLVLQEKTGQHGLWCLTVSGNSGTTPVLATTGADDGTGRLRLRTQDIIALKAAMDALKIPLGDRVLVLSSTHVADLLVEDLSFQQRYQGVKDGKISDNFYGFEIYESVYTPAFNSSSAKKAFGASPAAGDKVSSVAFIRSRAFQAAGTAEMYYQDSKLNTQYRRSEVGFRIWAAVLPMKNTGFGALLS